MYFQYLISPQLTKAYELIDPLVIEKMKLQAQTQLQNQDTIKSIKRLPPQDLSQALQTVVIT